MKTQISFCIFCLLIVFTAFAQEESVRVGPGKAVESVTKDGGFKLSPKAMKTIEVQLQSVAGPIFIIPADAIVFYGVKVGVYRQRDGIFHLVPVQIQKKSADSYTVHSADVLAKDQIAIKGVALLRVSEMDAFGGEE